MKMRLQPTIVGLAFGFAVPALAQGKERIRAATFTLKMMAALLFLGSVTIAYGQSPKAPAVNKNYLGSSSYGLFYGRNPHRVAPGPPSSKHGGGPPPRVGPNLSVNAPASSFPNGLLGRSETTIAQSGDGKFLVVGFNDAQGFCGFPFGGPCTPEPNPGVSGYAYSTDRGNSWTDPGVPPVFGSGVITLGDPSLDVGGHGNGTFYYSNLAFIPSGPMGVSVHRGSFSGQSFSWNLGATFIPAPAGGFLDKDLLAADKNGSRPNVYVSVTNFCDPFFNGQIEAYSSIDGGITFTRSIVHPGESAIINQGSQPAVGPDGTVYVAWERGLLSPIPPEIRVAKSTDFGATWGPPILVSQICSQAFTPPLGYNRDVTSDFPRIAVAENGPWRGRVYVTYQDGRIAAGGVPPNGFITNRNTDVYIRYSDDEGATWSAATLVAGGPDPQFFPVVSIEDGGNVDVLYYDQQAGTPLVDTYWAQSTDGGVTFKAPVKISTATSNWATTTSDLAPNFGDYITAVSGGNKVFATWADGRNGVPDAFFAPIDGAGKSSH